MGNEIKVTKKSLGNTDTNGASKNVSDLVVWGEPDMWKLLSKASSEKEGWMKSTKALEVAGVGCWVQVSTQQGDNVAESISFAENMKIIVTGEVKDENGKSIVTSRRLVRMDYEEAKPDKLESKEVPNKPKVYSYITSENPYEISMKIFMLLKMNKNCLVKLNGTTIEISRHGKSAYVMGADGDDNGALYCNLNWSAKTSFESFVEDFGFSALMLTYSSETLNDLYGVLWDMAIPLAGEELTLSKLDHNTRDFTRFVSRDMKTEDGKFEFIRHYKEIADGADDNYIEVFHNTHKIYRSEKLYKTTSRLTLSTTDVLSKMIVGYITAFRK